MDPSNVCPLTSGQTPRFLSVPGSLCPKSASPTCFQPFQLCPAAPDRVGRPFPKCQHPAPSCPGSQRGSDGAALKTNRHQMDSRVQGQGRHRFTREGFRRSPCVRDCGTHCTPSWGRSQRSPTRCCAQRRMGPSLAGGASCVSRHAAALSFWPVLQTPGSQPRVALSVIREPGRLGQLFSLPSFL